MECVRCIVICNGDVLHTGYSASAQAVQQVQSRNKKEGVDLMQ
jgi:hypothetical protein